MFVTKKVRLGVSPYSVVSISRIWMPLVPPWCVPHTPRIFFIDLAGDCILVYDVSQPDNISTMELRVAYIDQEKLRAKASGVVKVANKATE